MAYFVAIYGNKPNDVGEYLEETYKDCHSIDDLVKNYLKRFPDATSLVITVVPNQ